MGIKTTGLLDVQAMILRLDSTAKRRSVAALVKKAHEIRDIAREMAPIETHDLEQSIVVKGDSGARERAADGTFARTEVEVSIDGSHAGRHSASEVERYATIIHEEMYPAPGYHLLPSPLSNSKQSKYVVGGAFLDRAAIEVEASVEQAVIAALRDL